MLIIISIAICRFKKGGNMKERLLELAHKAINIIKDDVRSNNPQASELDIKSMTYRLLYTNEVALKSAGLINADEEFEILTPGNYVNIDFFDCGGGLAQIVDVNDKTISVKWATFFPCYSCQVYDESKYEKTEVYSLDMIFVAEIANISQAEFEKERAASLICDVPIFERYKNNK